jgi:hypothetical protein
MMGISIAHLSGHGADSGYLVVLALVAGVILVLLGLASVHHAAGQASSSESERQRGA